MFMACALCTREVDWQLEAGGKESWCADWTAATDDRSACNTAAIGQPGRFLSTPHDLSFTHHCLSTRACSSDCVILRKATHSPYTRFVPSNLSAQRPKPVVLLLGTF